MFRKVFWLGVAALLIALAAPAARADTGAVAALNAQVTQRGVWGNTSSYTPTVFTVGSSTSGLCVQKVGQAQNFAPLAAKWLHVPLPCYHQPSAGSDQEEVLLTPTETYEFWGMAYNRTGWPNIWSAKWGGHEANSSFTVVPGTGGLRAWPATEARYGTQASGIAFNPGIITEKDLKSGTINHAVEISAAWACYTKRFPATGTDGSNTADCLQYGTEFIMPASVDCSTLRYVARLVCTAAKTYGIWVTDQSHDKVAFRFENWKRKWASWAPGEATATADIVTTDSPPRHVLTGQHVPASDPVVAQYPDSFQRNADGSLNVQYGLAVNPYDDLNQKSAGLDFFGCDGYVNGAYRGPGQEYDCYPSQQGALYGFPWPKLVEANG